MSLTDIGTQKTPGRPVEITFAPETGLPSPDQTLVLIGHAASGATGIYQVIPISNVGSVTAASAEVAQKFGNGSELAKMVLAAVNSLVTQSTNFPTLKCIPLAYSDVDFGQALTTLQTIEAEYAVSPYDGNSSALRTALLNACKTMSGAQRTDNSQFGTIGVVFNRTIADPSTLPIFDSQYLQGVWLYDSGSPAYSIGEMASAAAAIEASNLAPFNPLDSVVIPDVAAPAAMADWPTVGAGLESEAALNQGWTPLYVKPTGDVAFVRTVTGRLSVDGSGAPLVTAYYDVQDFNVLYFFRKTVWTRFSQPDFTQRKASANTAQIIKSEVIRLMQQFQDQNMFQAVQQLAQLVQVERNISDRSRFDVLVPINCIPGLHLIATNIQATTLFDSITI